MRTQHTRGTDSVPRQGLRLDIQEQAPLSPLRQFFAGLGSALLNPKNAVFYLTLMTAILGSKASPQHQIFAGIWMTAVVFLWDAGLALCISMPTMQRRLWKFIPFIEGIAGGFLVILAGVLIIMPLVVL